MLPCLLFAIFAACCCAERKIVVLMFENRAFDHVLGHLNSPNINGLTGMESNPIDPLIANSPRVRVSFDAEVMLMFV
jgi:hypothetical protein